MTTSADLAAGYAHPLYASAMAAVGEPLALPLSGGHLVRRTIPGTTLADATGPYPLFACRDWTRLAEDLTALRDVVSVVLVADPFGVHDERLLRTVFPDLARPFKRHHVADLTVPLARRLSVNHRRNLAKLPADLVTERVAAPADRLDDWVRMYDVLVARHAIRGIAAFPRESFEVQFRVPGLRAWRAAVGGETVGMTLWYVDGRDAWYHLSAVAEGGYCVRCGYALMRAALEDLAADGVLRADLGGAAGLADDASDGLAKFKQGWSTETADAWLCGRVLDRAAYDRLTAERGADDGSFFPAYRRPAAASAHSAAGDRPAARKPTA